MKHSMVTIVNSVEWYIWNTAYLKVAKRVDNKSTHYKKKPVTMYQYKHELDLLWWSFHNVYKYKIFMLYIYNQCNITCYLYLNKNKT